MIGVVGPRQDAKDEGALVVQKDDVWYLDSLRESGVKPPSHAQHFAELDWLIGDWVGENNKGASGTDSFEWAENQNFIVSSFATTLDGVPVSGGSRWIAGSGSKAGSILTKRSARVAGCCSPPRISGTGN